ncbi:transcription initiation factor TFIID [Physcia stellaris]|nr:transcription initiation factor TFIID [Physcia stellaris]
MGQESSSLVDEKVSPETLSERSLDAVASLIRNGRAKKIVVMTGAGISTSAGIPDFRSPDTGLYANLARLDLPFPEAVFDISFFRENPLPFYHLAHELYPGKYRPTVSHCFVRLLSDKGLLLKLFTQNIDCLERAAGVPDEKIVEAHGSFARQRCIELPHCLRSGCNGLVKPDIVFFGEALPENFHTNRMVPSTADLCIVMGTSLTVQPFASLPGFCAEGIPRLLINSERVGTLGSRADDVLLLGDCDDGVRRLASALGWDEELEDLRRSICDMSRDNAKVDVHDEVAKPKKSKDDELEDEIAVLTKEVDSSLNISNERTAQILEQLKER